MNIQKLTHQPLTLVLAEFRFNVLLNIEKFIPDIQEKLRKAFPEFIENIHQPVQLTTEGLEFRAPVKSWEFCSRGRTERIRIDANRLVFATTEYDRFPQFQAQCEKALNALISVIEVDLLHRVGLRYNDTIIPSENKNINEYVVQEALPPQRLYSLGKHVLIHQTELQLTTESGRLVIKTLMGSHGLPAFPDLVETFGKHAFPKIDENKPICVMDFDHIWGSDDEPVDFTIDTALSRLAALHEKSREAFWTMTSDSAKEEWA